MLRRVTPLIAFCLLAAGLVLCFDGSAGSAHASLFIPDDEEPADYVPDDAMTGDAPAHEEAEAGPTLVGRGPTADARTDEERARDLIREIAAELGKDTRPVAEDIEHFGTLVTIVETPNTFDLTDDERRGFAPVRQSLVRRLADLRRIPADEGHVFHARRIHGWGMPHVDIEGSRIPGRSETYKQAARSMIDRAIEDVAAELPADKAAQWTTRAAKVAASTSVFKAADGLMRLITPSKRQALDTLQLIEHVKQIERVDAKPSKWVRRPAYRTSTASARR